MPNIGQALKEEIRRLAKKEAKVQVAGLKKDIARLKKIAVALRRQIAQLNRDNELLLASEKRRHQPASQAVGRARVTSKGVRALRRKLRLSQGDFAKLVGVSTMSVFLWEKKTGALKVKDAARAGILALRGMGAREAKQRLKLMK
ncbi:MAG: hypothetical protein QME60_04765 [Verrucomicrobiota bacterium]|nr:hypothetical protein [Verrucomicrobiota bacterium]